jgi:sirohydrochlorin cobaltochelatase
MTKTAVLICGHGSRDPEAIVEFELLATALRPRFSEFDFAIGYLEFARPTIRDGLAALAARGARRILAIPGMLLAGSHVKRDLPREISSFMAGQPEVDVRLARDLSIGSRLRSAATDRIATAVPDQAISRAESMLVVAARGANDPDANSSITELASSLGGEMGFGAAEAGFAGVAQPRVEAALGHSARLGFRRIIVFPYFLFAGVLVKRIYLQTDAVASAFPKIQFVKALHLRDHPEVLGAFDDRVREICDPSPAGHYHPR